MSMVKHQAQVEKLQSSGLRVKERILQGLRDIQKMMKKKASRFMKNQKLRLNLRLVVTCWQGIEQEET